MGCAMEAIVQPRTDARNEDNDFSKRQSGVRAIVDRSYWSRKRRKSHSCGDRERA